MKVEQNWSAALRYTGREVFWFGTVRMPVKSKMHEIEAALMDAYLSVIPHSEGLELVNILPGSVCYIPEKNDLEEWSRQ